MQDFGAGIGLSRSAVSHMENGARSVSAICNAFNANEEWLKTGVGKMALPSGKGLDYAEYCKKKYNVDGFSQKLILRHMETPFNERQKTNGAVKAILTLFSKGKS
jgi:hypothetical protein